MVTSRWSTTLEALTIMSYVIGGYYSSTKTSHAMSHHKFKGAQHVHTFGGMFSIILWVIHIEGFITYQLCILFHIFVPSCPFLELGRWLACFEEQVRYLRLNISPLDFILVDFPILEVFFLLMLQHLTLGSNTSNL